MNQSIGEQLKFARLQRNLTLEQVEKNTRIRKAYLEAMENDQLDQLPSPVQAKGFLRLYAGYLNIDSTPFLAIWDNKPSKLNSTSEIYFSKSSQIKTTSQSSAETQVEKPQNDSDPSPSTPIPVVNSPLQVLPATPKESLLQSQKQFNQIGEILRNQRINLGLTLDEVEKYTRVKKHYLNALETGNMNELPSPVQGRGMLNNYALFLNLDADGLLQNFAEALQSRRIERMPQTSPTQPKGNRKKPTKGSSGLNWFTTDLFAAGGIIIFLIGFVIWGAARITSINENQVYESPPSIGKVLMETPTPRELSPTVLSTAAGQVMPGDRAKSSPATLNTGTLPPINDAPIQVYIIAKDRAFLRIVVDGKEVLNSRITPGNAYAYSGAKQIELLTGSAGAIQVYYNQKDLGILGLPGQAVNLVFTPRGLITPTATSSPTYTATLPVTLTNTPSPSPQPPTPTVTIFVP